MKVKSFIPMLLLLLITIIVISFIGYEFYLHNHPEKYQYRLMPNGDKIYGCTSDYKCPFGTYCGIRSFGRDLPGIARECKLILNIF